MNKPRFDYLTLLTLTFIVSLLLAWSAQAQTTPQIGGNYYIAAQTWDGQKYIERLLYLRGAMVEQTTDINQASQWEALTPAHGKGVALRSDGKYLMRGGTTSASWGCLADVPEVKISNPPSGSLTLLSTVKGKSHYIIAPNAGTTFTGANALTEATYQSKHSNYTPYFKFYPTSQPMVSVSESLDNGHSMSVGAYYRLTTPGGQTHSGNLWPMTEGTITIDPDSYNSMLYTFMGFHVGDSEEMLPSVSTRGLKANTSIKAVFVANELLSEVFTLISSSAAWYANQQTFKAISLDPTDCKLKWRTYDPEDPSFYFVAHGTADSLTLESMAFPGMYITGANTEAGACAATLTLERTGGGEYNIMIDGKRLCADNHAGGYNESGNLGYSLTDSEFTGWWLQTANDMGVEQARHDLALMSSAAKALAHERELSRDDLYAKIQSVSLGDEMASNP